MTPFFYQHRLQEVLDADPAIEVVGVAANGQEAIEKTQALKPDVITMDVEMPVMDGISAVRKIMNDCPTPVLMISSATKQGAKATFEAMDAGALDFLTKDFHEIVEHREEAGREICNKVISVAKKRENIASKTVTIKQKHTKAALKNYDILAVGCIDWWTCSSTTNLKKSTAGLSITDRRRSTHARSIYTDVFERLDQMCNISVKQAENGDALFQVAHNRAGWTTDNR